MFRNARRWMVLLAPMLLIGCGGRASERTVAKAYTSFDDARSAFESKDFATAEPALTSCIEGGGLQADILAEAYLMRGVARVELGNIDGAQADLDLADQGGVAAYSLHEAKAGLYRKQGDEAKAKAELKAARQKGGISYLRSTR